VAEEEVVAAPGIERIQQNILALSPQTDVQRWFQSTALQVTREIAAAQQSIFRWHHIILAYDSIHKLWLIFPP
jgi:hypothetical protein